MAPDPTQIRLTDPRSMRALAHPTRLRLLGELRLHGPQTVGQLSDRLDEAVGSISYHLGKLAAHGLVEEVPELARNRRERWWRAAHTHTVLEPAAALADPDRRIASDLLRRTILDRYQLLLLSYLASESALPAPWVRAATSSDAFFHLTAEELGELRAELEALVDRWNERGRAPRADTSPVTLIYHAFRRPM